MLSESVRLTSSYPISGKLLNKGMTRKPRPSREYSWRAIPRYAPHITGLFAKEQAGRYCVTQCLNAIPLAGDDL